MVFCILYTSLRRSTKSLALVDIIIYSAGYSEFFFVPGSVTCHGDMVQHANCPKDQYMVVKNASYRGLPATKTCGLSDDY
jgi:hypothetical protein